jgi:hypothetical protein
LNMAGAGLGLVGNGVEAGGAAILAGIPEPLSKVGAVGLAALALDGAQANVRTLYNWGEPRPTLLNQGVTGVAGYALDRENAQLVGAGVDFVAQAGAQIYSGGVIKGALGAGALEAPNAGTHSLAEQAEVQAIANKYNTTIDVVGSRPKGQTESQVVSSPWASRESLFQNGVTTIRTVAQNPFIGPDRGRD